MPRNRLILVIATLALAALMPVRPGLAAGWRFANGQAGLWADGAFNGLVVGCGEGGVSFDFFGFPARLEAGTSYSVVVTVDGTARRLRAKADGGQGVGSTLSATLGGQEAADLIEALGRGRKAEVATPAGRYDLPLAGSSKALDALRRSADCPG
ncbi:hypothetical protein E3C22_19810 [Jiella endophytica]|uniref:Uncharacterized protein n=1 Tax=Jiella endophytica TaxID=2558362 RepID=A0A4Y8RDK5_9HYPH|nr:hypothetical protein [Jiella endophytica]TFF19907.1 hypothetical protein E3C22_19810 [Jiella endophytica]